MSVNPNFRHVAAETFKGIDKPKPSTYAWAALMGGVALWDTLCPKGQTLSEGVDGALERPVGKYVALGGIALTALHLANAIPEQIDVIHQVAKAGRRLTGRDA